MSTKKPNIDPKVTDGFGDEWKRFDQTGLTIDERQKIFDEYFRIFPWEKLPKQSKGFDLGCGSGRWAQVVATRVAELHCIDASLEALNVARRNLSVHDNCIMHHASVDQIPLPDESMDFGYSLGVLHHVPDTLSGIESCVRKLKPGAPFLLYLYYRFDNKPLWFRLIWVISDGLRRIISYMPHSLRYITSQIIAGLVYWPLARLSKLLSHFGIDSSNIPLSYYKEKSFYVMRTDALDRFGTRLEQRFTCNEIKQMMEANGLENIIFSSSPPYWCAVGIKKRTIT